MNRFRLTAVLFAFMTVTIFVPHLGAGAVPVIFDTDMGNDIDDALALAVIHSLESRGECRLLGVTLTKEHPQGAPFVDAINTFYGRGSVPIGEVRDGKGRKETSYLQAGVAKDPGGRHIYPHDLVEGQEAEDAVALLRRLLTAAEDHSVVIIQVGFSTNLAALLETEGDAISDLSGADLVRRKVRLLSAMAGNFVESMPEFNVREDRDSAAALFSKWPTQIVFSGFEIGRAIPYPATSIEQDFSYAKAHPIVDAYRAYSQMPYDRPTWDLTSVLFAVRPERDYFGLSGPGKVSVDPEGRTAFQKEDRGSHRYLTLSEAQKEKALEALVQLTSQPPCN